MVLISRAHFEHSVGAYWLSCTHSDYHLSATRRKYKELGDFGKMLYASYYGLPWEDMLTMFHFGNCELLLLAEGTNPNEPHVVKIEQHNH